MKTRTKRRLKKGIITASLVVLFYLFCKYAFVPLVKYLFVTQPFEIYEDVADKYSSDGECIPTYQGTITDTMVQPSATKKGKYDTIVHHRSVSLSQQSTPTDGKPKVEDIGAFSDGAGLLNAFFSFLAFIAVVFTITLQLRKDSQDKRNNARMQFEQEFFAMVNMLEDIVSHLRLTIEIEAKQVEIDINGTAQYGDFLPTSILDGNKDGKKETRVIEGRDVFRHIYIGKGETSLLTFVNKSNFAFRTDEGQRNCFDGTLDHYFRYLYRILKHIDKSELLEMLDDPDKERKRYAHLLRAQLSNYELLMWFYNSLLKEHLKTAKRLIERYAMFNNLRVDELGNEDQLYYRKIRDFLIYENPIEFDEEKHYSITAFWDKEDIGTEQKRKAKVAKKKLGLFRYMMANLSNWMFQRFCAPHLKEGTLRIVPESNSRKKREAEVLVKRPNSAKPLKPSKSWSCQPHRTRTLKDVKREKNRRKS